MKSGTLRDGARRLALLVALAGLVAPILAEDFEWQGSIGQGMKASILIPGATKLPVVVMQARSADAVKSATSPIGTDKHLSWIVDLRLMSQIVGKLGDEHTPKDLLTADGTLLCIIDLGPQSKRDATEVYFAVGTKGPMEWVKATDLVGAKSTSSIVLKSDPLIKGPLLILEFLAWPKEDPMIGGT